MARGKFNKRGGGKRFDAVSAEEVELRNTRLEAFQDERLKRRADEAESAAGGGGEEEEEKGEAKYDATAGTAPVASTSKPKEPPPVHVTSEDEHRRNMAKLEYVKRRREVAEKRRKSEEEEVEAAENARLAEFTALQEKDEKKDKKKSKGKTIPKLTKIDIKKMKPAQMKEALKERELEIQGNAKELTDRLLNYEMER
jgi:hypothetical protein